MTALDPQPDAVFRLRTESLSWRLLEDEVIALDLEQSVYLTANSSGALLWGARARGAARRELAGILVNAYELDPAQASADAEAFLADAAARDLLA